MCSHLRSFFFFWNLSICHKDIKSNKSTQQAIIIKKEDKKKQEYYRKKTLSSRLTIKTTNKKQIIKLFNLHAFKVLTVDRLELFIGNKYLF